MERAERFPEDFYIDYSKNCRLEDRMIRIQYKQDERMLDTVHSIECYRRKSKSIYKSLNIKQFNASSGRADGEEHFRNPDELS